MPHELRFRVGGALTNADRGVYIGRRADSEILEHLVRMDYVLVVEPRQQGKTSLINRVREYPSVADYLFVYLDLTTLDTESEAEWYKSLYSRVGIQLAEKALTVTGAYTKNGAGWRGYLRALAEVVSSGNRRIAIILDEVGAVPQRFSTGFFSVLRDLYNSRQIEEVLKSLTFVLVGAFHPRDLITDERVSPFNVARRVRLLDFDVEQITELTRQLIQTVEFGPGVDAGDIAARICWWCGGQPYIVQWLCDFISKQATPITSQDVDRGVDIFRREDGNHLPSIVARLRGDKDLQGYLRRIMDGARIGFFPGENPIQAALELLGVLKEGSARECVIRNRIVVLVLQADRDNEMSDEDRSNKVINSAQNLGDLTGQKTSSRARGDGVDFVIITALPEERDAVLQLLPGWQLVAPSNEDIRTYFVAEIPIQFSDGTQSVYTIAVFCLLGMGRVQAATATSDAIRRWKPRYVLLVGIAGGVAAKSVRVGDIIVSDQIVDYELQKITSEGPDIRWEVHRADPRLLGAVHAFSLEKVQAHLPMKRPFVSSPAFHVGPIASGDKVVALGTIIEHYRHMWSRLIGIEMEAGGVATAASQSVSKPGFLMVRGVSDLADENKGSTRVDGWRAYACLAAAAFAIELLRSGPVPSRPHE